jgi:pyrroloquinoline quinone (PQQ) biosynthesis protein C
MAEKIDFADRVLKLQIQYLTDPDCPVRYFFPGDNLPLVGAQQFMKQIGIYSTWFPRWTANVMGNCPYLDVQQSLIQNMYDELVRDPTTNMHHYDMLCRLAEGLGLSREEVDNAEPLQTTVVTSNTWTNWTKTRHWIVGFAALQAIEGVNDINLTKKHNIPVQSAGVQETWAKRFGVTKEQLKFFAVHDYADQKHAGGEVREMTEKYLRQFPYLQEEAVQIARESLQTRWMFLDGIRQYSEKHKNDEKKTKVA